MGKDKWFFGWTNIKWFIKEMMNIYIESGIGFAIAEWGMILYLLVKIDTMSMVDFGMWATIQFFIAGYIIRQIQREKVNSFPIDDNDSEESEK
jgi:hypothetical protein